MKKIMRINGMSCGHCSAAVEKALCAVPGVTGAKVDLAAKTAAVETEGSVADETLKTAVTEAGYEVVDIQ